MERAEEVQKLHDSQDELWGRVERLLPELFEPAPSENDAEQMLAERDGGGEQDEDSVLGELRSLWSTVPSALRQRPWSLRQRPWSEATEWPVFDDYELLAEAERHTHWEQLLNQVRAAELAIDRRDVGLMSDALEDIESRALEVGYTGDLPRLNAQVKGEIEDTLLELEQVTPRLMYRGAKEQIQAPARRLILEVSDALAHRIAREPALLYHLTPREFEEFIAELFSWFGYEVHLTARTRDGGRDIVAVRGDHGILSKLLIECKRFSPTRPVGLSYVRELYAVKTLEKATKAILATTSYFSRDARRLESQLIYELELKDFQAVTGWARDYSEFLRRIRHGP